MDKVVIEKLDETWIYLDTDLGILQELDDAFKFRPPNYQFVPAFKNKVWDGYIHLVSVYKQKTYLGLYTQIKEFCDSRDYEFKVRPSKYGVPGSVVPISLAEAKTFVDSLQITSKGVPLEIRDYQYRAVHECLSNKRQIILSPTGSGKSAQIYSLVRFFSDDEKKVLLIVPTIGLTTQMKKDFEDYSSMVDWNADAHCHIIYAGQEKNTDKSVTISTWQSAVKQDPSWFEKYDAVIVDETHLAKAKSISMILESCKNASYKLGFTGSLDNSQTHKQVLTSLIGPSTRVASTRDLIDKGQLSNITIKAILFKYPDEINKVLSKADYQTEIKFIIGNSKRNRFIRNLAMSLKGNTLILFNFVDKHGQIIYDMLSEKIGDRAMFVHGGVDADDRESIRQILENENDVTVVASMGTFSTGINVKNLPNIILASPTKSIIRVLQSVGRGLRLHENKEKLTLFDLGDDFRTGKKLQHENHTYKHFGDRLEIYSNEQFDYNITTVNLMEILK